MVTGFEARFFSQTKHPPLWLKCANSKRTKVGFTEVRKDLRCLNCNNDLMLYTLNEYAVRRPPNNKQGCKLGLFILEFRLTKIPSLLFDLIALFLQTYCFSRSPYHKQAIAISIYMARSTIFQSLNFISINSNSNSFK